MFKTTWMCLAIVACCGGTLSVQAGTDNPPPVEQFAASTSLIRDLLEQGVESRIVIVGDSQSVKVISARIPLSIGRTWPLEYVGWVVPPLLTPWFVEGPDPGIDSQSVHNSDPLLGDLVHRFPMRFNEIRFANDITDGEELFDARFRNDKLDQFVFGDWAAGNTVRGRSIFYINENAMVPTVASYEGYAERDGATGPLHEETYAGEGFRTFPEEGPGLLLPPGENTLHMRFFSPQSPGYNEAEKAIAYAGTYFYLVESPENDIRVPGTTVDAIAFPGWKSGDHARHEPKGTQRGYTDDALLTYLDASEAGVHDSVLCIIALGHNDIPGIPVDPEVYGANMATIVERYDSALAALGVEDRRYLLAQLWRRSNVSDLMLFDQYRDELFEIAGIGTPGDQKWSAVAADRIAATSLYHYHNGEFFTRLLDGFNVHPNSSDSVDFFTSALWDAIHANPACPGDINHNGAIDVLDLLGVLDQWGACGGVCPADANLDGKVDVQDLLAVIGEWGPCP